LKYLDTNVIVYAIENHPKYGEKCKKILQDVESGKLRVSCSMLVLVELMNVLKKVNRVLSKQGRRELIIEDNVEALLSIGVAWIDLDFLIVERASSYSFDINGVDYIHVASMETNSISEILSADADFDRVPTVKRIDPLDYGED
jgi:predicted nucleic acid-binding protein